MTNTPESPAGPNNTTAVRQLEPVAELAAALHDLSADVLTAAERGDSAAVALAAEQLLPLHVDFARVYRTWLARRVTGDLFALGTGDHDRPST